MNWKIILITTVALAVAISCKKNSTTEDTTEDSDSTESVITESVSEAGTHASSSEGGSGNIASQVSNQMDLLEEELRFAKNVSQSQNVEGYISPEDQIHQLADGCRYTKNRTCSSGTGTIAWDSCTITGPNATITMTGGWTETWSNIGDCTLGYLSANGDTVRRSSTGSVINFATGATITTDTAGGTAHDGTVFVSGKVITTRGSGTNRSIAMDPTNSAVHKVLKGRRGTTLFDYYTVPSLTVTGSKSNGSTNGLGSATNRAVTGTVKIYHNLLKYTGTNTFDAVTWGSSTCCFPTSGTITTTFTGSGAPAGPIVTTFGSTCGSASMSVNGGAASTITLTNCQ